MAGLLVLFWFLFTTVGADWVAVGFYVLGVDPRDAADQPVLDAGQRRLRSAAGQAAVRLHRRRRQPRRRQRRGDLRCFWSSRLGAKNMLLISAAVMGVSLAIVMFILKRERSAGTSDASETGEEKGVSGGEAHPAAALVEAPAGDRDGDRLCRHRRGDHRAAAEHGGGRGQGRGQLRRHRRLPGADHGLPVADRLRHPGRADQPHSPRARHRLRAADPAGQPRHDRGDHAVQPRAVGAEPGAHARHLAALHRRQDLARGAVPAAAVRTEVPRQAVHRRHDGSAGQGHGRAADPRPDQGLGPRLGLAATELRQPGDGRLVGADGDPGAQGIPAVVPPQHRAAGREAGGAALQQSRPERRSRRW